MHDIDKTPQRWKGYIVLLIIWLATCLLVTWVAQYDAQEKQTLLLQGEGQRLQSSIHNELDRFRNLPTILALNPLVVQALDNPSRQSNVLFERLNQLQDSDVTYLLDVNGNTLAASNWQQDDSFVGSNYSYRPYFQQARQGHNAEYFALGSRSGRRGYYFSAPILVDSQVKGVVVVKVALQVIDKAWRNPSFDYLLTDRLGVVFYASKDQWNYHSILPLSTEQRKNTRASRQYGDHPLHELDTQISRSALQLPNAKGHYKSYQMLQLPVSGNSWQLYALAASKVFYKPIVSAVLLCSIFYLGLLCLLVYWRYLQQRRSWLAQINQNLEQRVEQRTQDLSRTNNELKAVIHKYQITETELKQTQQELVQAAKLATLGELSAGINHELNQPLTALRSYAENTQRMLDKSKYEDLGSNLTQIVRLTELMSNIVARFKVFSRKSQGKLACVSLDQTLSMALSILANRLVGTQIKLVQIGQPKAWVLADQVQLEQVLINLLNNAIDALSDQQDPLIQIEIQSTLGKTRLGIWDNGAILDEQQLAKVFEPFFTTKQQGLGLGMAISKRIIEGFDGSIHVTNYRYHDQDGPLFTLELNTMDATK
ncbi:sensor histidine kinase [Alginatibacterium sediminis]|uniref:C4-dicarboxylate transport sensor protein DctB n=1 Tax=Alginatibacterium sediminis TaxID=2164068 RepID=A0A420E971_9ALTE|nr:ATP-binding protein [Alginatibacterium sediminis]RKF15873.1 sensor histidine kinase [Alginatibacterium sediminis]